MKKIIYILTLLLLVIPTSSALACGNNTTDKADKEMSCSKSHNDHDSEKKSCCDSSSDEDGDNVCNGNCNDKNCHCPVSVNVPIPANNIVVSLKPLIYVESNTWAYVQSIPKPVYLSIWKPPKIS